MRVEHAFLPLIDSLGPGIGHEATNSVCVREESPYTASLVGGCSVAVSMGIRRPRRAGRCRTW